MTANIVRLTMNPALAKSAEGQRVVPENKLRCQPPRFDAGGGGINVARAVTKLGGELSGMVIIVLGFASLLADGFSMAASNYLGVKSEREEVRKARGTEERHIAQVPHGEREKLRQIFSRKGFEGDVLEKIVKVITDDRTLRVDTLLVGGLAAALAYGMGHGVRRLYDIF